MLTANPCLLPTPPLFPTVPFDPVAVPWPTLTWQANPPRLLPSHRLLCSKMLKTWGFTSKKSIEIWNVLALAFHMEEPWKPTMAAAFYDYSPPSAACRAIWHRQRSRLLQRLKVALRDEALPSHGAWLGGDPFGPWKGRQGRLLWKNGGERPEEQKHVRYFSGKNIG